MFPRGNSFLILHKESFSRATASRMAMAEGRGSENNRQWRLQWDLPVEILLPKHHQRYSLCLAAGGDVSLHSYLSGQAPEESQLSMLACFLIYHSVPTPRQLAAGGLEGESGIGIQGDPASSVTGQLFLALQQPGNTVVLRLLRGKKGSCSLLRAGAGMSPHPRGSWGLSQESCASHIFLCLGMEGSSCLLHTSLLGVLSPCVPSSWIQDLF